MCRKVLISMWERRLVSCSRKKLCLMDFWLGGEGVWWVGVRLFVVVRRG